MIRRGPLPSDHFTTIANAWTRDERLSWRARGILAYLCSHRVGWQISERALVAQSAEGRHAIRTALAELEGAGYLVREQTRDEHGRMAGTSYTLTDPPRSDAPWSAQPTAAEPTTAERPPKKNIPQKTISQKTRKNAAHAAEATTSPVPLVQASAPAVPAAHGDLDVDPPKADQIIAAWIDWRGSRPPARVVGHVAREVKALVEHGINERHIRSGLAEMTQRELHPSALASVVDGIATRTHRPTTGGAGPAPRRSTTDERVAGALSLVGTFDDLTRPQIGA